MEHLKNPYIYLNFNYIKFEMYVADALTVISRWPDINRDATCLGYAKFKKSGKFLRVIYASGGITELT